MAQKEIQEKRRYPRAKHVVSIHHRLYKRKGRRGEDQWHISLTENISAGGVLFASEVLYEMGDILELKIIMAGALSIYEGLGKVVRIEPKEVVNIYKTAIYFSPVSSKRGSRKSQVKIKARKPKKTKQALKKRKK